MPISVTCECGKSFNVGEKLAGKAIRCKACGGVMRVPVPGDDGKPAYESGPYLSQTKTMAEGEIRCPNCGRSMAKTLEICRHCGKSLRHNIRRTVVVVGAAVVTILLLVVVIIVFLLPSRKEVIGRKASELARYLSQKHWSGVFELDRRRTSGVNFADYTNNLEQRFKDLEFKDVSVGELSIDPDTDVVSTEISIRARHKTAEKSFSRTFRVEWEQKDGKWYAFIGQAKVFTRLGEYVDSSIVVPEKKCENCDGSGRARCDLCGSRGRLGDQSFCPQCYKAQGWIVCPVCRGTGVSAPEVP